MIRWLVQCVADHPQLSAGRPPAGLLASAEMAQYEKLLSPRRRRDWLLGRWTAKHLANRHIALTQGFSPALDSLIIDYDASDAPYITSDHPALRDASNTGALPLALSISHSSGYAFCGLCEKQHKGVTLGVDIELVEKRPQSFVDEFLTAREQAKIQAVPPDARDLLTTAIWSVKEATLKATHLALRADPSYVECEIRPIMTRHWTPLHVRLNAVLRSEAGIDGPLRVWWRVIDNRLLPGTRFVLSLAAFHAAL
jgi:4'-phosphopantetheinyl transferase